jgi:hypothetical protein
MQGDLTKTNCYEKLIIEILFRDVKLHNSGDPATVFGRTEYFSL